MERRRRHRVIREIRTAALSFDEGRSNIACSVRDISDQGARILIDTAVDIPEDFVLKLRKRRSRLCRLLWQSDKELGVIFVRPYARDKLSDAGVKPSSAATTNC